MISLRYLLINDLNNLTYDQLFDLLIEYTNYPNIFWILGGNEQIWTLKAQETVWRL